MDAAILLLSIAYALPLALFALLLAGARRRRAATLLLMLLPAFYLLHYFGLRHLTGWPASGAPPERFDLLAEYVIEPEPTSGSPGALFLWVKPPSSDRPRAYRLPYTRSLHETLSQAAARRSQGRSQVGERRPATDATGEGGGGRLYFADKPGTTAPAKEP